MNEEAVWNIAHEIIEIMAAHDEQMNKQGYVDAPGGLEHMDDVWTMLARWRDRLTR